MLPGLMLPAGLMGTDNTGFQSYASGTVTNSASLVINKPTGTVSGDTLVAVMADQNGSTWTGASGWTERVDQGASPGFRVAMLTAGGSEPSSYTFTSSIGITISEGMILCFRGFQYDTIGGAVSTLSGDGTLAISGITAAGGILLALAASNQASGSIAHTTPTGFVKVATSISSPTTSVGVSAFYKQVAAGATGSVSTDVSGTTVDSGGILLGLKP